MFRKSSPLRSIIESGDGEFVNGKKKYRQSTDVFDGW